MIELRVDDETMNLILAVGLQDFLTELGKHPQPVRLWGPGSDPDNLHGIEIDPGDSFGEDEHDAQE